MPHSSGGGSHSGGSHHSSHHGSGGGRSSHRVSNTYFHGSRRYVVYRNHQPIYRYANYDVGQKPSKARYLLLIFYLPFILVLGSSFISSFVPPSKLKIDYDGTICIEDNAHVLYEETDLMFTLNEFKMKTGIAPAVITVYNEDWKGDYPNLETYAYDLYVTRWADEKHWLIVYSQPKDSEAHQFVNWYWEGMQGNDTDKILTNRVTEQFTEKLHRYLSSGQYDTVDAAINQIFLEMTPTIMKVHIDFGTFIGMFLAIVFIGVHMYFMVFFNPKGGKEMEGAVPCPENVQEDVCDYCNGVYVVGTVTSCPHCGATIRPHEYYHEV